MWRIGFRRLSPVLVAVLCCGPMLAGCGTGWPERAAAPSPGSNSPASPPLAGPPPAKTSATSTSPPAASPPPTAAEARCAALVRALSRAEQLGQLFMVGVPSTGLSADTAATLARTRVGSVILLGNTDAGVSGVRRVVADVRQAARVPQGVNTLLAADQEGGQVQRLKGPGFSDMPSARTQGSLSDAELARRARGWGRELQRAGIDANLAPVADVVPERLSSVNQPIGVLRRGFGSDPAVVARKARAVVSGMDSAGVATAVKHFPGLGRVRGNTDLVTRVVDDTTRRNDPALAGFAAAADAGVDMVMVSSAYYTRIDAGRRAAHSRRVIETMIRGDLGFSRVVISDDLAAPGLTDRPPGEQAVRFFDAGGDLVIVGEPRHLPAMLAAVRNEAADDSAFADRVAESARRVLELKAARGLAEC